MEAGPASTLEMAKADLLFELLVVTLYVPSAFSEHRQAR